MKTTTKYRKIGLLLSLLCAGIAATFFGGCAESPYVTAYDTGYYPTRYYTPSYYDYYGSYPSSYYYPYSYYNGYQPDFGSRVIVR